MYQRTTAAAEVKRSWSSIRSWVYVASTDETNERRQTHQFLKGGITHVTWAVRRLTRINAEPGPLEYCPRWQFNIQEDKAARQEEGGGDGSLLSAEVRERLEKASKSGGRP